MFGVKDISFSLGLDASNGEFLYINCQNSSSKPRTRRSLLKELNLATTSDLIARKGKLYDRIHSKESALWKLRKKDRARKLK
jgi:hypothetical protein